MVSSILIYYLLLVYQLAMLTNLIEELDNASKSIDIVTLYLTLNLPFSVHEREPPRGNSDILLHVTCILLIMTLPIIQMVSCRGPPQNTGPQATACIACPIATPLGGENNEQRTVRICNETGKKKESAERKQDKFICFVQSFQTVDLKVLLLRDLLQQSI